MDATDCDTVTEIIRDDNCPRGCLIRDEDRCPACNNTCQGENAKWYRTVL